MLEDNGNSLPKLGEHSHSHQPQVRQEQDYYTQGPAGQAYYQATATVPVAVPVTPLAPAPKPRIVKRRWSVDAPHPLLWVALGLSIVAVILGVPKGTLPTLTGRHRTLRAQELLVQEHLTLITQLSAFLPPPLASLFAMPELKALNTAAGLDMVRLSRGLRLWYSQGNVNGNWWTLEDLGAGAHVVRAASVDGRNREVWVLRSGDQQVQDQALLAALTNSLMARERLYHELDAAREPCPPCPAATITTASGGEKKDSDDKGAYYEEQKRLRDRSQELEEREQDVIRREMWVVEAMRTLSDKSHNSASELSMEDRVVERLKAYQRQIQEQV